MIFLVVRGSWLTWRGGFPLLGCKVPGRDAQGRGGGGAGAAAGARRRWGEAVRDGRHGVQLVLRRRGGRVPHRRPVRRPLRPRLHEPVRPPPLPFLASRLELAFSWMHICWVCGDFSLCFGACKEH